MIDYKKRDAKVAQKIEQIQNALRLHMQTCENPPHQLVRPD
jgi:hypothetical protein